MAEKNTFEKAALFVTVGRFLMLGFNVIFTPILVRVLSQAEYGTFAAVLALINILTLFSNIGLMDSVRKHVAEYEDSGEQSAIVATGIVISLLYGVVITTIFLLVVWLDVPYISENRTYYAVMATSIIGYNLFNICRSAFYGRQQEQYPIVFDVTQKLTYFVVGLGLVAGIGLVGIFIGYVVSYYVAVIVGAIYLRRHFVTLTRKSLRRLKEAPKIAKYGAIQAVGGISAGLLYQTDVLLIDYFNEATQTALYRAALVPAEFVWFVPSAIQMVLLQSISNYWANDEFGEINDEVTKSLRIAGLFLIVVCIGLFGLTEQFLSLYFGPEYVEAATSLRILLFGTFLFGLARVLVPVLQATGWIVQTESVTVVCLVVNIVLNLLLIPEYGLLGAAVATSISYGLILVGTLILWYRAPFTAGSKRFPLQMFVTVGIFGLTYVWLVESFSISTLVDLVVFPPLGGLMFLLIATLTGLLTRSDYEYVYAQLDATASQLADRLQNR